MEETMSIELNPKNPDLNCNPTPPPPKKNLFCKWLELIDQGNRMEMVPCEKYCERNWIKLEPGAPDQNFKLFESCIKECNAHKEYCIWSRRN
jgi:hypothetical protein